MAAATTKLAFISAARYTLRQLRPLYVRSVGFKGPRTDTDDNDTTFYATCSTYLPVASISRGSVLHLLWEEASLW